jgi:hypothetical protein
MCSLLSFNLSGDCSMKYPYALAIAATVLALLLPMSALAGDPGSAGLLSLRLGMGGRNGGMGETGVANSSDATGAFWNPANLAYASGTEISVQHSEYLSLFREESLALVHPTRWGSFGLHFGGFYTKDELVRTADEPAGVELGTFQPYTVAVGGSYAHTVGEFSVGLTSRLIYQRIDLYDGMGISFDIGAAHQSTTIEGLAFGAMVQNLGSSFVLEEEEFDLPMTVRMGGGYVLPVAARPWLQHVLLATDVVLPNDGNGRIHYGAEWQLQESFALRGGYRQNYESLGFTMGAGFARGPLRVDYAFMESRNDLDATHRISLSYAE